MCKVSLLSASQLIYNDEDMNQSTMNNRNAKGVTFRLTEEARILLDKIAKTQGISKTATLEVLIRKEARAGTQ